MHRLGHAHDVDRLARLVGRDADHRLDAAARLATTARTSASAPRTLVLIASVGKYSQVGTCFSAAAWITTSASRDRLEQRREVADVADAEGEQVAGALVDDVVGGGAAAQEAQPHVVLLGFVARQHGDLGRPADAAFEQPPHDALPERSGSAGDENPLAVDGHVSEDSLFAQPPDRLVGRRIGGQVRDHRVPAGRRDAGRRLEA